MLFFLEQVKDPDGLGATVGRDNAIRLGVMDVLKGDLLSQGFDDPLIFPVHPRRIGHEDMGGVDGRKVFFEFPELVIGRSLVVSQTDFPHAHRIVLHDYDSMKRK